MANEQNTTSTTTAAATTDQTTETAAPKFMTAEDFNGAMTARERRFEQRIEKLIEKSFTARQSAAVHADDTADAVDEHVTAEGQDAAKKTTATDPALKRMAAKIEALHKQAAAKEEASAKEKAELLQRQEKSDMLAALSAAGVTTAKGAYAMLKEEGRIKRNADGELVIVVMKDYAGAKMEEEVPIAAGVKEWLATDDGKHFALPRGGGDGSGTVIRGGAQRSGGTLSKEEAKREAQSMLTKFVLGGR